MPFNYNSAIQIEIKGLEEVRRQVAELVDAENEQTVFKAEMGEGMKFEGTKSDFEVFIKGVENLHNFVNNVDTKRKYRS